MARPLRLQFHGAFYHLTSRGDRKEPIFLHDTDRGLFLDLLGKEIKQQGWICYAYCLMDNHYHLLIETPEPNLVQGMRRLNGVYTQGFNRRHRRVGHVFQGRYKAILVDKESYLLELCRYVVLNPLRAKLVKRPEYWPWSSYWFTVGKVKSPDWLAAEKVMALFSGRTAYKRFVAEGMAQPSVWNHLRGQIYLGRGAFLKRMESLVQGKLVQGINRKQLRPLRPEPQEVVAVVAREFGVSPARVLDRSQPKAYQAAVYLLRRVANLSLRDVAQRVGVSPGRISQIQAKIERGRVEKKLSSLLERYKL